MTYFICFLEGIITFLSPCMLPMLPIYISYFTGSAEKATTGRTLRNSLGFVTGFTLVFIALGASAGALGRLLNRYSTAVNIVGGLIVIFFGIYYTGLLKLPFLSRRSGPSMDAKKVRNLGFFSSTLFGIIFSVAWTPCLSAFLASALSMAATAGHVLEGILMLLCFSLGLGIPFVSSALLLNQLSGVFNFIKKHYKVINIVCGCFLILVGIAMMTGTMNRLLALLTPAS